MADPPRYPGSSDELETGDEGQTSQWVYVLVAIGILVIVLLVTLHLTGVMGPGSH